MVEKESRGDKNYRNMILVFIASILLFFIVMSIIASPESLLEPLKGHPWNKSNINIHIDIIGIPVEEVDVYTYNALLAFRWWESKEGMRRLGYQVNFTQVYNPKDTNINIKWTEKLFDKDEILGHTYINTTVDHGDPTCDAYYPPFTQCNITIKLGLSDNEMQNTIKHEIGHAFGIKHSFNLKDFIVFWFFSNNLNSPTDIMFDLTVVYAAVIVFFGIFCITFGLIYPRLNRNKRNQEKR